MKQVEDARAIIAVGLVERLDSGARVGEQGVIAGQGLLRRVAEIRQQGKEQIGIAIAEITDLQGFEQIVDLFRPAQQGGDDHHGAVTYPECPRKIQSWQRTRRHDERDQQVHQRDGQRRDADQAGERKKPEAPVAQFKSGEREKHDRGRQRGEQQDGAEVKEQAKIPARPAGLQFPRQTAADRTLQHLPPVIDQVVPDMRAAVLLRPGAAQHLREHNGFARHRPFTARTASGHIFDDMPVAVARGEILAGVHPRRVFTQGLFDDTERLDVISASPLRR